MKKIIFALLFLTFLTPCFADSHVFTLVNPHPEEILDKIKNTYGDKIQADLVQGRLLVVGTQQQIKDVAGLLASLDPIPRALRLTLRDQPPADDNPNTITYSTDRGGYVVDGVEGEIVVIDYRVFSQQPSGFGTRTEKTPQSSNNNSSNTASQTTTNGWWVTLDNVPTHIDSLMLRVTIDKAHHAIVVVSYNKVENQEHRVYANTVMGNVGAWIPLLPRPADSDSNTISSGPRAGEQLYLRVDRNFESRRR